MDHGKAYGFFYCSKPFEVVTADFNVLPEMAQTSGLELKVVASPQGLKEEPGLSDIISLAEKAKLNYAVKAQYAGASNEQTCQALQDIFNLAYSDPDLYDQGEEFRCEVFYWDEAVLKCL